MSSNRSGSGDLTKHLSHFAAGVLKPSPVHSTDCPELKHIQSILQAYLDVFWFIAVHPMWGDEVIGNEPHFHRMTMGYTLICMNM